MRKGISLFFLFVFLNNLTSCISLSFSYFVLIYRLVVFISWALIHLYIDLFKYIYILQWFCCCDQAQKTSVEICEDLNLEDVSLEFTEADYQNLTTFSLFSRMVRPQMVAVSSIISLKFVVPGVWRFCIFLTHNLFFRTYYSHTYLIFVWYICKLTLFDLYKLRVISVISGSLMKYEQKVWFCQSDLG